MDIIKKCNLIINNTLISNQGYGSDDEVELEIYTEIKNTITAHLESIVSPIIQDYKAHKKNSFYMKYSIDIHEDMINQNLLSYSINQRSEIRNYFDMLKDVNEKIDELNKKLYPSE